MESIYNEIEQPEGLKLNSIQYTHAAHVIIYSITDQKLLGKYPKKAIILMQMRFDGTFGFTGGIVDAGETPLIAVNRETSEELGLEIGYLNITDDDFIVTHFSENKKLCLHLYAKSVTNDVIPLIENKALKSADHGQEVLGIFQIPLYTLPNKLGFPAFLGCQFIGNSKLQLKAFLIKMKLLSEEEFQNCIELSENVNCCVSKEEAECV